MTGPTHAVLGLALMVGYSRVAGVNPGAAGVLCVLVGSLAPDIDGEGSITRPGRILSRFLPRGMAKMVDELAAVLKGIVHSVSEHRGLFHWPLWGVVMIAVGASLGMHWLFWIGIGYLAHILGDFCTTGGVPLFGPISFKKFSCVKMKTGSWPEAVVFVSLLLLTCFAGWDLLPEQTREALIALAGKFL